VHALPAGRPRVEVDFENSGRNLAIRSLFQHADKVSIVPIVLVEPSSRQRAIGSSAHLDRVLYI
jgi:hypothetical protein